jgi:hypothetical protein
MVNNADYKTPRCNRFINLFNNPMKNFKEEIVNAAYNYGTYGDINELEKRLFSLFRQAIDEVIGEDEKEELGIGAYSDGKARNQLRAEQRERGNQLTE